ncbi:MAG: DUF1513 domain-containing protein [Parvibaculaceae bacterium]
MAIDRRQILIGLAAALATPGGTAWSSPSEALYVACRDSADKRSFAAVFSADGREVFSTVLPARGHDAVERPGSGEIVVFARRPGNWAVAFDPRRGRVVTTILSQKDRHFLGHGAFTADGKLLYAGENDTKSGNGVLGIYDATDGYRRITEIPSLGIGPHDIKLMGDGRTLVVANGALKTLPESGREILNLDSMRPNLAFIDMRTHATLGLVELGPELRQLSIRHLAVAADGTVAFGCQYQGSAGDLPLLVGLAKEGKAKLLDMPELELSKLDNYVGSVAIDDDQRMIAVTSPRGGSVALWELKTGSFHSRAAMSDVCGLAPLDHDAFLLTSGNAGMRRLGSHDRTPGLPVAGSQQWMWDNHMRRLKRVT